MIYTKIRGSQIQPANSEDGIIDLHIKANAAIATTKLADGPKLIKRDGTVDFTAPIVVVDAINPNHAVSKSQLSSAITAAADASGTLTAALNAEINARTSADTGLQNEIDTLNTNLTNETNARQTADSSLTTALNAEASTRSNADDSLQANITAEQNARINSHSTLQSNIDAEASSRAVSDTAINGEITNLYATKAQLAGNSAQTFAVAAPTQASHAATKAYVDGVALGLDIKGSCRVASVGPLTLSGLQIIDDVQLGVGDRVLIKNQADPKDNGIYVASEVAWTYADDCNNNPSAEVTAGVFTFVEEGATNAAAGFVIATPNSTTYKVNGIPAIELGVQDIVFSQFSGAGQIHAGVGLSKSGNTLYITDTGVASGTYTKVVVNSRGQITLGANPTTLAGYGIIDAAAINGNSSLTFQVSDGVTTSDAVNMGQLTSEITARTNAVATLTTNLTTEGATRASADTALNNRVDTEITNRTNADQAIRDDLASTASSKGSALVGVVDAGNKFVAQTLDGVLLEIQTSLEAEVAARSALGTGNAGALAAEVTARTNGDSYLQSEVDTLNSGLVAEATARSNADSNLQSQLDTEAATRLANDGTLQNNITAEANTRATNDTTLQTNITAEATARANEDATFFKFDGSRALTGDVNAGGKKITLLGAGTALTDAITLGQLNNAVAAMGTGTEWQESCQSYGVVAPGSPVNGTRVLIVQSFDNLTGVVTQGVASGVFTGKDGQIATFNGSSWSFTQPAVGTFVNVDSVAGGFFCYTGTWAAKFFETTTASTGAVMSGRDVQVASSIAGKSLTFNAGVVDVVVGDGLVSGADKLDLTLAGSTLTKGVSGLKVAAQGVTAVEINTSAVGAGLTGGAGAALSVVLNNAGGIENVLNALGIKLATNSYLIVDANGLAVDSRVMTTDKLKTREVANGVLDGVNCTFVLSATPVVGSEMGFMNGLLIDSNDDYTIDGPIITMSSAPLATDKLRFTYVAQ
jgi:hypothetical protein